MDPCHYFSSPGLSWDAMLKTTGIKTELISDIDKHLFTEKRRRGVFLTLLKDLVNQIINACNRTKIIYMIRQGVNICPVVDLNG